MRDKDFYRLRFQATLEEWVLNEYTNLLGRKCSWMGVPTLKNPLDMWIHQELIFKVKPDVIIEIGSAQGGSTFCFANILDCMKKGIVISIDFDRSAYKVKHDRIVEMTGYSSSPEIIGQVSELCKGKTVFVNQDGAHNRDQVFDDLMNYSRFVSLGSYFVVEDGLVDVFEEPIKGGINGGPMEAIEKFLKINPGFVVDEDCERYILTYNPNGYLRRIA